MTPFKALTIFLIGAITTSNMMTISNSNSYTFDQKITVTVTSSEDDSVEVNYLFNSNNSTISCIQMNAEQTDNASDNVFFVLSENSIDMFMNAGGMKMRKSIGKEEFKAFNTAYEIPEQTDIQKTGQTKSILGYLCYEYKFSSDEGTITAWICPNFPIQSSNSLVLGAKTSDQFEGFVMELYTTASNEKSNLKVTAVDFDINFTINTNSYKNFKF